MTATPPVLLLVADSHSYNLADFEKAARALGARVAVATDRCATLAAGWAEALGDDVLAIDLRRPERAVQRIVEWGRRRRPAAILSLSDKTTEVAARAAAALGLPHNPPEAARAARSKIAMRRALQAARVSQPEFRVFELDEDPERAAQRVAFPCVLKPALLSASRGVIRADDAAAFVAAWRRVRAVLEASGDLAGEDPDARRILVEGYVPGIEVALEALLDRGHLRVLAIFDKPDPLEGPYFEETLYVTPSRHAPALLDRIVSEAHAAAAALGLVDGPVHAELRASGERVWVIEMAARTIGGLCARTLRFGTGMGLEELVIRHRLGLPLPTLGREAPAAGALMLPIPRAGILKEVRGVERARAVAGIEDVVISIAPGEEVVPVPEGNRYLGFLFARGSDPATVEASLREAHRALQFEIVPRIAKG